MHLAFNSSSSWKKLSNWAWFITSYGFAFISSWWVPRICLISNTFFDKVLSKLEQLKLFSRDWSIERLSAFSLFLFTIDYCKMVFIFKQTGGSWQRNYFTIVVDLQIYNMTRYFIKLTLGLSCQSTISLFRGFFDQFPDPKSIRHLESWWLPSR
jgi:hypothetical protein